MTNADLREGAHALAKQDRDLGRITDRLGVPPMWGRAPGFATLVRIILEQQVSLDAARTLYRRLVGELGGMTPEIVHERGEGGLRDLGLTRQKARYCAGLAEQILEGRLDLSAVARGSDEVGRKALLAVPGLGPWTVDIYYLMALRRPDIWPKGDLALAVAMQEIKRPPEMPDSGRQEAIAAAWTPWRSVAARTLWAHYLDARGR